MLPQFDYAPMLRREMQELKEEILKIIEETSKEVEETKDFHLAYSNITYCIEKLLENK